LESIAAGDFRRIDLSVAHARQIRAFHNDTLARRLGEVWGAMHEPDEATRHAALQRWRQKLTPEALKGADLSEGQKIYTTSCGACHKLYGVGGSIGPDLTGSGRQNLDYLLDNILFPSAVIPAEFRQTTLTLKDGRTLSGVVRTRTPQVVKLEMIGESATLSRTDILDEATSEMSLMPEGQLDAMSDSQAIDLIGYLMSSTPPPSKTTP
jgi:putative heme-binding domain-containing protein